MVQRRASNWLEDEILYNPEFQGAQEKTILIFSHGLVIKTLLHYILGFSDRYIYRFKLDNTGICEFKYTEEGWFPISINDTSHLK
jgi:broad specificity phosphatase PhoE